ncbi:hypothetical protein BDZ89DRAFT_1193694 [Hymenopellis radicata]|nr:hypothetical protein BDZ89DRAFT_1193694 [Hymenopellis radicata]
MPRENILGLMEKLDDEYSSLKRDSKDADKTREERAADNAGLERREQILMPMYKQMTPFFADLHDLTSRMEAKGCTKSAVWRELRRYFYWVIRWPAFRDEGGRILLSLVLPPYAFVA